jgi:hypothetical protein
MSFGHLRFHLSLLMELGYGHRKRRKFGQTAIAAHVLLFAILISAMVNAFGQSSNPAQSVPALSDTEYRQKDLEIRVQNQKIELKKAWITAVATSLPILAGLLAVSATIFTARRAVIGQFAVKAAEIALQGEGLDRLTNSLRANVSHS